MVYKKPITPGWYLLCGQLERQRDIGIACLNIVSHSSPDQPHKVLIPIMRNGRIREIIFFPADTADYYWTPVKVTGIFEHDRVQIKKIGILERIWWMAWRVKLAHVRLSKEGRHLTGLTLPRIIRNLKEAYRVASQLRLPLQTLSYTDWFAHFCILSDRDRILIRRHIDHFSDPPHFQLLLELTNDCHEQIKRTIDSICRQLYRDFTITILDRSDNLKGPFGSDSKLNGFESEVRLVYSHQLRQCLAELRRRAS